MIPFVVQMVVMPILGVALVLACVRLVRGPTLADRVVALDLLTLIGVGIAVAQALAWQAPRLLDVALVLALIAFIGTVAFARYLERMADSSDDEEDAR